MVYFRLQICDIFWLMKWLQFNSLLLRLLIININDGHVLLSRIYSAGNINFLSWRSHSININVCWMFLQSTVVIQLLLFFCFMIMQCMTHFNVLHVSSTCRIALILYKTYIDLHITLRHIWVKLHPWGIKGHPHALLVTYNIVHAEIYSPIMALLYMHPHL